MARPSRLAHDMVIQRAIRALPALPVVFTAKQLQRLMPDRSANQCRRLMQVLVARGYCTRSTKAAVAVGAPVPPADTFSDRVLALFATAPRVTVADAIPLLQAEELGKTPRIGAFKRLERMVELGLLRRTKVAIPRPPHWRVEYTPAVAIVRTTVRAPEGCRDPHCACPLSDADFAIRDGRLVRTVCRRHEVRLPEARPCSR